MRRASFAVSLATAAGALFMGPDAGQAQSITLRTVPIAAGNQFDFHPSVNAGMGRVSIAISDSLADAFSNPGAGGKGREHFFLLPSYYSISDGVASTRTIPIGMSAQGSRWFGSGVVATQSLSTGDAFRRFPLPMPADVATTIPDPWGLAESAGTNQYVHGSVGLRLSDGVSIGVSAMLGDIDATDGVEQLFANAWSIDEYGSIQDYRLGLVADLDRGRRLEAVLLHSRYRMTHDITSVTWELTDTLNWLWTPTVEDARNLNKSDTWGAHVEYRQPLEGTNWDVGGLLTLNRKLHPKIPTYDLQAVQNAVRPPIPRDPGHSWALNIGAGMAWQDERTTFAMDLVYEPAISITWADALEDVTAADGSIIPAGDHTVDNDFSFSNASARIGASRSWNDLTFQLGTIMRTFDYRLEQDDHVRQVERTQTEQWTEWTPTWGIALELEGVEVRYIGSAMSSSHFPFPSLGSTSTVVFDEGFATAGGDVLAPPAGNIVPPDQTVVSHRIQASIPIG